MKYLSFITGLLILACNNPEPQNQQDPYAHIEDTQVRTILQAAIEYAGGLERWESIKRLAYTKDFHLLDASGEIERSYRQIHDYRYGPLHLNILSIENGDTIHTVLENGRYARTVNDTMVNLEQSTLEQSVNTSTYVVSMPFKLLDSGPVLKYLGADTLGNGQIVDIIELNYNADAHDNLSSSDIWRYYFDRPDRKIVANWVKTSDHFSLVENLSYARVGGILFNKERKSYRVDSLGNKLYLRAEYWYDNYQVE